LFLGGGLYYSSIFYRKKLIGLKDAKRKYTDPAVFKQDIFVKIIS
jgi:hypothetical protein